MFSEHLRNTALGVTIALSAMGLSARSEEDQGQDFSNRAVAAETFDPAGAKILSSESISRQAPSGALKSVKLPVLDGPVSWGFAGSATSILLAGGILGGLGGAVVGFAVGTSMEERGRNGSAGFLTTAALGVALGAGGLYTGSNPPSAVVEFDTKIVEVVDGSPAHYEKSGKTTTGPFFGQVVMIPELPIPLAVNVKGNPFISGQNIHARVALDHEGHIIGWRATPGLRQE
jgi:hypothetical protein